MAAAAEPIRQRLEVCILAEAEEQKQQLDEAYNKASDKALLSEGILLTGLIAKADGRLLGELVWRLQPRDPSTLLPRHKFKPGSNVNVRPMGSQRSEGVEATVLEIGTNYILITVSTQVATQLTKLASRSLFRLEQGVRDVTTRRQLAAIGQLGEMPPSAARNEKIVRAILLGSPKGPVLSKEAPEWMNIDDWKEDAKVAIQKIDGVNLSQKMAIAAALTRTFTLWQGPPGTGKTRTLLAFLKLLCHITSKSPDRKDHLGPILAVADTNAAADNILEGLLNHKGINVVRIGRPAQVRPELRHACLDALAERSTMGQRASNLRDQAATMLTRVQEALAAGKVGEKEVQQSQREAQRLWSQADAQLNEACAVILSDWCDVVVGTCASAGEARIADKQFRVVVIDEATQATEPSTLVALTKGAESVVMAGDHAQLPPTVVSRTAIKNGLDVPLFARLQNAGLPALVLNTQYRMHPEIAFFPSQRFYNGQIASGVSAEERPIPQGQFKWPSAQVPVAFLPIESFEERASSGAIPGADVGGERGGASFRNVGQAELAVRAVHDLLQDPEIANIAVLTPYNGQVRLLTTLFQQQDLLAQALTSSRVVVSSVDGFQGREADAVVFTTVRCNSDRSLGFLGDARRMNVAITRARRGLIVIGSPSTLQTSEHWAAWLQWVKKQGAVGKI